MKYLKKWYALLLWAVAGGTFCSCDMMTDDRDHCPTGLYVTFDYDYNLERADMFNDHVGAVTLYVFNPEGKLVKVQEDYNSALSAPLRNVNYMMHVDDLAPGKYQFLVLASQKRYQDLLNSNKAKFIRSEMHPGSDMKELSVTLDHQDLGNGWYEVAHSGMPLDTLWHGAYTSLVEVYAEKPTYTTIPLVRNTKRIGITLRELDDPTRMDVAKYDMKIVDRNATLRWDNSVDTTKTLVYTPHATWNTEDKFTVVRATGDEVTKVGRMAHADFMTSRILYHEKTADDGVLVIRNKETNVQVATINLPDILSRLRSSDELHRYSEQEFLDRGYDYDVELFLAGDKLSYINISISILGWSQRIQFADL